MPSRRVSLRPPRRPLPARATLAVAAGLAGTLVLAACGGGSTDGADAGADGDTGADRLQVVAAFYAVEHAASRVGGDRVEVAPLTSAGVDPHDLELSPRAVASLGAADLVLYSSSFQPAVDDAVAAAGQDITVLDVNAAADLVATTAYDPGSHAHDEEGEAHDGDEGHADEGDDHGALDPHFWLDPERYSAVVSEIAGELSRIDPEGAGQYEANAADLVAELDALDAEFADGLSQCAESDVVTTHAAFGYLTDRYGLHQVPVTGLAGEDTPSPARLAEVTATVHDLGVSTVYAEPIAGADLADTIARETGAQVRVLDPLEGITPASPGDDYFSVMRATLAALTEGQDCS